MSPALDQIVSQLDNLSPDEIKQLKARTSFLLDHMQHDNNDRDDFGKKTFYEDVAKELRERGVYSLPPYYHFRRSKHSKTLDRAYENVSNFIEWHMPRLKRTEHRRALRVLAGVLVQIARHRRVPLNLVAIFNAAEHIHTYVDEAFPGYAQSGMMHAIIGVKPRRRHKRVRADA